MMFLNCPSFWTSCFKQTILVLCCSLHIIKRSGSVSSCWYIKETIGASPVLYTMKQTYLVIESAMV